MINLLKADFYKLLKTKMGYILLIVCAALSLLMLGIYGLAKYVSLSVDDMPLVIAGRAIMFSSFSLSSNIGIIIPIFVGIFTLTDIRHGTIRNKILFGESRTKIYLSHLIVSITLSLVAAILSFIILAIGSLILFGYGAPFEGEEIANFFRCLIIGILSFIYVATISTFFALITKSTPMTVLLTLAVTLGLPIIISLFALVQVESYKYIFYLIPSFASSVVSNGGEISVEIFIYGLCSLIFFSALNIFLGIILFKKIDIK